MRQKFQKAAQYFAALPDSQHTLGGEKLSFKFNRLGRAVERLHTLPGITLGVLTAIFAVPALGLASSIGAGIVVAAMFKGMGLGGGALAHFAGKDLIDALPPQSKEGKPAKPLPPLLP